LKVAMTLLSADGKYRQTVSLGLAEKMPVYGVWPRPDVNPKLADGIGYLRLAQMDEDAAQQIVEFFAAEEKARGIIVDVRNNGGGSRDALIQLASLLMKPDSKPRVVNASVYRLHPEHDAQRMATRFLYPEKSTSWNAADREAIAEFKKSFKPEWSPTNGLYSEWHYMVLRHQASGSYSSKPVVVLMDAKCFSATDVFLAGLKGLADVTLLGTPSGGGSANTETIRIGNGQIPLRIGTMVSFQSDGKLFDTHGIEPDVTVEPEPEYFIGGRDTQLQAAVDLLMKK
jgi:C-terminal processing protease CtpA/Prc